MTMLWVVIGLLVIAFMVTPKQLILSGSMQPTLPYGSTVVMETAKDLKPTDIIVYQQEGDSRPTAHTFIGYAEDGSLMTKGDANPTPDVHNPPLKIEDVKGRVAFAIFPQSLLMFTALVIVGLVLIPGRRKTEEDDTDEASQSHTDTSDRVPNPA